MRPARRITTWRSGSGSIWSSGCGICSTRRPLRRPRPARPRKRSPYSRVHARPHLPSHPRLAFAESSADAEKVLAQKGAHRIDAVVALAPEAAWTLQQAGERYLTLEDAYEGSALCGLADPVLQAQES